MRLITRSKLWRAFPELDSYPDERCQRFVKAAKRGWRVNIVHTLILTAVFLLLLVLCVATVLVVIVTFEERGGIAERSPWKIVLVPVFLISVAAPPLSLFIGRDILLRRRVRYVLRTRGVCASCSYGLVGLAVSSANTVTCPECAFESEVDPALGELTRLDDGRTVFNPSTDAVSGWLSKKLSPARHALLKKTIIRSLIAIPVVICLVAASYEAFIRWQASRAVQRRPTVATWQAVVDAAIPPTPADQTGAWDEIARAMSGVEAIEASKNNPPRRNANGQEIRLEYTNLLQRHDPNDTPTQTSELNERHAFAIEVLDALKEAHSLAALDAAAKNPNLRPTLSVPAPTIPIALGVLPAEVRRLRAIARLCVGRMALAIQRDDPAEFEAAAMTGYAVSRLASTYPMAIGMYITEAIDASIDNLVLQSLVRTPTPLWLDTHARIQSNRPERMGAQFAFDGERVVIHDFLCWFFSDPSRTRFGRFSPALKDFAEFQISKPLGTLDRNMRLADEEFDAELARLKANPDDLSPRTPGSGRTILIESILPSFTRIDSVHSTHKLTRGAIDVMIALERYRRDDGGYPERLDQLVPGFLNSIPVDSFTSKPLCYKRVDPQADPEGRDYLLYSTGPDRIDNGGQHPSGQVSVPSQTLAGKDFVFNRAAK